MNQSMSQTELAVVGAGPAGLKAAVTAAQAGVAVTLIDEYPALGGQYLRRWPPGWAPPPVPTTQAEREGLDLGSQLESLAAVGALEIRLQTLVWGLFPGHTLSLYGPSGPSTLRARCLLLATGAYERGIPFPGWTLPGVMTGGGLQTLVKGFGIRPGHRILLAGSGPFLGPVATQLWAAGVTVVAVLEATSSPAWFRVLDGVWGHWEKLRQAWNYLRTLRRAGVPLRRGWTIVQAHGGDRVEAAEIAPVADLSHRETVSVDGVGLSFGFIPLTDLPRLAGCGHRFRPSAGGWVPHHDEHLESTVPGLFVAGETAGVGGADKALIEGQIAGIACAQRLGHLSPAVAQARLAPLLRQRRHHQRFAAFLNTAFGPPPELHTLATEDTLLCRCEEVSVGEVRAAVRAGITALNALKTGSRVGQGFCQGRVCGPLLADFVAREAGLPLPEVGAFSVRPPVRPVPLEGIAGEEGETGSMADPLR